MAFTGLRWSGTRTGEPGFAPLDGEQHRWIPVCPRGPTGDVRVAVLAANEDGRLGSMVRERVAEYAVFVGDDGSTDGPAAATRDAGATVV